MRTIDYYYVSVKMAIQHSSSRWVAAIGAIVLAAGVVASHAAPAPALDTVSGVPAAGPEAAPAVTAPISEPPHLLLRSLR